MTTLRSCQGHLETAPGSIKFLWTVLNKVHLAADRVLWAFLQKQNVRAAKDFLQMYCPDIRTLIIHGYD